MKVGIYYGSTTGNCEEIANRLVSQLEGAEVKSAADFDESAADYDVLVLGTSTWGDGEVQDDWYSVMELLKSLDLSGKKVVLFGCGDSQSYCDTFCGGMKGLYDALQGTGATIVEGISTEGYDFGSSESVIDDKFVGYAFDEVNEPEKTDERLEKLVEAIKAA